MGSPENEPGHGDDETLHTVQLTQGFFISQFEVTTGQFSSMMNYAFQQGWIFVNENETAVYDQMGDFAYFIMYLNQQSWGPILFENGVFTAPYPHKCVGGLTFRAASLNCIRRP